MCDSQKPWVAAKNNPSIIIYGLIFAIYIYSGIIMLIATLHITSNSVPQQAVQYYAALCLAAIGPYCFAGMLEKILLSFHNSPVPNAFGETVMNAESQAASTLEKGLSKKIRRIILVIYLVAGLVAVLGIANYLGHINHLLGLLGLSSSAAPQQAVQYAALCWVAIGPYCFAGMLEKILLSFHNSPRVW